MQAQNKKLLDSLQTNYQITHQDSTKILILTNIAAYHITHKIDSAISMAQEALNRSEKMNFERGKNKALHVLGLAYQQKSNYVTALDYFQKSLKNRAENHDKFEMINDINNIAYIYKIQGNYPLALDYYQKNIKLNQEIDNKENLALTNGNIGMIYQSQGNYLRTLEYLQKKLKIKEEIGNKQEISYTLNEIANIYETQDNHIKALEFLQRSLKIKKEMGDKEIELHIALGNAYKADKKNSEAVGAYQRAMNIQSNLPRVEVNIGEIWTQAYNFDLAETTLKGVIAKDPNFGPAYRALAENYYRWGSQFPNKRAELLPKAQATYSKYLDLTDRSAESRYRYLIFLLNAGDYTTLEKEALAFTQQYGTTKPEYALAQRFLGYAYIENGKAPEGAKYLNSFITGVDGKRVIADDYLYLGKAYQTQKQDSLAIINFVKGYDLDTTNTQVLTSIAKSYFSSKKYGKAADYYRKLVSLPKSGYADKFYLGYADYFYYATELANKTPKDQALITKTLLEADSLFTFVGEKAKNGDAYLYLARVEYYLDPADGLKKAANAYDKYIEYTLLKGAVADKDKKNLIEAYLYNGAAYIKTDKAKAKVKSLMQDAGIDNDPSYFLRVGVVGGGCSGLSYK
ncbi:MAG: tetratricopeptide repeat protein, partial [Bacteroidetes bacterium]